jgi:Zn finger protein HypA/HybF involved in hydrogenase expression
MMHVDGNALAGPLSEIFSVDVTNATAICASCSDASPLATSMVYLKPNTYIVRCHVCDSVMLTITQSSKSLRIDLSGTASLTIPT